MRKCAGLYVSQDNINNFLFDMIDFKIECSKELLKMKSEIIDASISLYNIVTKRTDRLVFYLQYIQIGQFDSINKYKEKFPIYYAIIDANIQNGLKRIELLKYGEMFFDCVFNSLPTLPYVCQIIFGYLDNEDLLALKKRFKIYLKVV